MIEQCGLANVDILYIRFLTDINGYTIQVAVLAPLALLLVLEAHCTHFVIAHFINIVSCGVVHLLPHSTYIHDDKLVTCYKDVSEHYCDCNGNS